MTDGQDDESEPIVLSTSFEGPTPHPAILHQYEQVLPGSADRVFRMAEKALDHQISMDRAASTRATLGLLLAPLVAIAVLVAAIVMVIAGQAAAGVALIVAEVGALIALFLRRKNSANDKGNGTS